MIPNKINKNIRNTQLTCTKNSSKLVVLTALAHAVFQNFMSSYAKEKRHAKILKASQIGSWLSNVISYFIIASHKK